MVRRLIVIACCLVVCGAPLAESFCYEDCANRDTPGTHHSCTAAPQEAAAISAAPHSCAIGAEAAIVSVDVRHVLVAFGLPPAVWLNRLLPIVRVTNVARSDASDFSLHLHSPLRI